MFILCADKNELAVRQREPVTSGSVNVYGVSFEFSEDWAGLNKTAVFQAGCVSREVLLGSSGACVVPWEVLRVPGYQLKAGVYGNQGGEVVLPTVWADLGVILEGVSRFTAEPPEPVPPPGGVTDHRQLTHRDAEGQHPMEAIEGLAEELRRIPAPVEPLTNEDLEELLK